MGIGNWPLRRLWADSLAPPLPLMGIGNPVRGGERAVGLHLITPHGDWKPSSSRYSPCRSRFSLPLMGIGNLPDRRPGPARAHLITPHGDWKPLICRWCPTRNRHTAHYPSWGLETCQPLSGAGQRKGHALITPHGDWKPLAPFNVSARGSYSLPLMGIGNWRSRRSSAAWSTSHYPSWGLETGKVVHVRQQAADLITPHGDWKPT